MSFFWCLDYIILVVKTSKNCWLSFINILIGKHSVNLTITTMKNIAVFLIVRFVNC